MNKSPDHIPLSAKPSLVAPKNGFTKAMESIGLGKAARPIILTAKTLNEPATWWAGANALSGYVTGGIGIVVGTILFIGGLTNAAGIIWRQQQDPAILADPKKTPKIFQFFSRTSAYFFFSCFCTTLIALAHLTSVFSQTGYLDISQWPALLQTKSIGVTANLLLMGWALGQTKANMQFGLRQNKLERQTLLAKSATANAPATKTPTKPFPSKPLFLAPLVIGSGITHIAAMQSRPIEAQIRASCMERSR